MGEWHVLNRFVLQAVNYACRHRNGNKTGLQFWQRILESILKKFKFASVQEDFHNIRSLHTNELEENPKSLVNSAERI